MEREFNYVDSLNTNSEIMDIMVKENEYLKCLLEKAENQDNYDEILEVFDSKLRIHKAIRLLTKTIYMMSNELNRINKELEDLKNDNN